MANKITGKTDTSGALSTIPIGNKSVLLVGSVNGSRTGTTEPNKVFSIVGTTDATDAFGSDSKITTMVKILISNGVDNIKGIIVEDTASDGSDVGEKLASALEASLSDKTVKVVICDDNSEAVISAVKDHLVMAEENDIFRYSVFAPTDTSTQQVLVEFAKTVDSDRIFIPGVELLMGTNDVHPQITACGLASLIMTETDDPALPMNGVGIRGFNGVKRHMLEAEMNALVNGGITPIYEEGTTPTVFRLVTSKLDDQVWQEGTTRFIADYVLESVENMLRNNYKRTKNVVRILNAIKSDIDVLLKKIESLEIIENYDPATLTVSKDPTDAYGALVDYEFDVVTPLYTITINQHLKL